MSATNTSDRDSTSSTPSVDSTASESSTTPTAPSPPASAPSPQRHRHKSTARMSAHAEKLAARTGATLRFLPIDGGATSVAYSTKVKIVVRASRLDWQVFVAAWIDGVLGDWVPTEMTVVCEGLKRAVGGRDGDRASLPALKQWFLGELYGALMRAWEGDEGRVVEAMAGWGEGFAERLVRDIGVSIASRGQAEEGRD
ncbi:hypothetical protein GTA08_BOTSDO08430 [Botryosphaeria dothidea]|uniref:Uncharacterized protein n=1 Tax=Botryosphaeria dothidea TaxID=55169 RepID=A0A8H4IQV5_9PEZI|nr:hypothetical protein GTA08_BOTSDO08430 [Botryosphaeria dothidea]